MVVQLEELVGSLNRYVMIFKTTTVKLFVYSNLGDLENMKKLSRPFCTTACLLIINLNISFVQLEKILGVNSNELLR